jgi:hypothetical protein
MWGATQGQSFFLQLIDRVGTTHSKLTFLKRLFNERRESGHQISPFMDSADAGSVWMSTCQKYCSSQHTLMRHVRKRARLEHETLIKMLRRSLSLYVSCFMQE